MTTRVLSAVAVVIVCAGLLGLAGCGGGEQAPYDKNTKAGAQQVIVESEDSAEILAAVELLMQTGRNERSLVIMQSRLKKETDPAVKKALQDAVDELGPEVEAGKAKGPGAPG